MSAILKTLVSRVLHLPTRGETLGTRLPQTSLFNPIRVNREEWLGGPATFRGLAYCFGFDVEPHHHVTLTAHTFKTKMADDTWRRFWRDSRCFGGRWRHRKGFCRGCRWWKYQSAGSTAKYRTVVAWHCQDIYFKKYRAIEIVLTSKINKTTNDSSQVSRHVGSCVHDQCHVTCHQFEQ